MGQDIHELEKFGQSSARELFHICAANEAHPFAGQMVKVTWLRAWGGHNAGYSATGELKTTFAVRGRTLVGEILVDTKLGKRTLNCPWSKNYITVELI